jgi:ABC-type lipoprotein release transport system permease subunit
LIGIEPEKEVTTLCKGIIKGRFLTEGRKEIVISEKLAQVLNITSGESVAILSQGFDGSLANDLFEVVGIFKTSGAGIGEEIACIPFKVMKNFLSIPYGAHEIVVLFQDYRKTSQFLSEMKKWNMSDLEILPWYKVAIEFYKGMQADRKGMWLSLLVVLFIISLGVLNTLLMAVLERTREFGLLKALGTSSEFLIALIYTEAFLLLFAGILSGFILAYPCNLFFSIFGIAYPEAIKMGGIEIKKMYTDLTFNSFFLPAIALFFSTLIVCIWPALRILKILPIEALKKI